MKIDIDTNLLQLAEVMQRQETIPPQFLNHYVLDGSITLKVITRQAPSPLQSSAASRAGLELTAIEAREYSTSIRLYQLQFSLDFLSRQNWVRSVALGNPKKGS